MWNTFPLFGSALLLCVMVVASYTFAVSVAAGANGKPRTLQAARFGAYGTVALIFTCVVCLAYAFVSHDFRLRYVSHYSDRSMPLGYLLTALWGGQDGSLLWWLFLLSLYIGVCVRWLGKKYLALQPYVIATLMGVVLFFCVLMAFAANPFSTSVAGARADGEGLNPLLQNFYMIIHPPSLYTGFVGCTIPFAFGVAALVTGRLDTEWIVASRKFTLFSWMFLAIGNTLGMLWAYEELGWGGYWAWDPVENAAFLPFLTASAFIHSVMIQERRGLLKVWNVTLVSITFFMTIFGTFLTRSGAIASVHSFAQSSIGTYFLWFLALVAVFVLTLVLYRWPELRDLPPSARLRKAAVYTGWTMLLVSLPGCWAISRLGIPELYRALLIAALVGVAVYVGLELVFRRIAAGLDLTSKRPEIESLWSREFTFLLNNWGLLGFMVFVLVATTFPMISEAFWNEKVTVGPPYYNAWVQPIGLTIFFLMGLGSCFGWKKTSDVALKNAFRAPLIALVSAAVLHVALGSTIGFPAVVWSEPIYAGALGRALRFFNAFTPVLGFSLCVFNATVIVQEFYLLFRSRSRSGANKTVPTGLFACGLPLGAIAAAYVKVAAHGSAESMLAAFAVGALVGPALWFLASLVTLSASSRRRYGGYVVHFGIVLMLLGFTGKSWTVDRETTLSPHQTYSVEQYKLEYLGPRMEVDNTKRMVFADVHVWRSGKDIGEAHPAKFIYKKMPDSPTTEVAMMHAITDDLYLVVGTVNPQSKTASFQIHINPLVGWIWLGCLVLIVGSFVSMWPELQPQESRAWAFARGGAAVAASVTLGILLAVMPTMAYAQQNSTSSLHSGTVKIDNPEERAVFNQLRCMCGTCARDLLSTCACETADEARENIRRKLHAGETKDQIVLEYEQEYGDEALAIPPNKGALRAIYAVPLVAILAGGAGMVVMFRRWQKKPVADAKPADGAAGKPPATGAKDEYDRRLDDELKELDG